MSTPHTDASEAAPAAQETPAVQETHVEKEEVSAPVDGEATASNEIGEPANDATEAGDAPKKRGRKRKASVTEDKKAAGGEVSASGDAVEPADQAAEKPQAKKAVKKTKASPAPKKKVGRPRKTAKEDSEPEDDGEMEVNKLVDALPEEIKSKFGSIVWAKMVGYPYWPGLIADPRRLVGGLQASALKDLDTKYMVCFYGTKNFAPLQFKNVESWDDKTFSYREGHPAKDAKAPKRRSQLMAAIEEADKDAALPIEERMGGLLKVVEVVAEPTPDADEEDEAPPAKRKPGRPAGSKNKSKAGEAAAPKAKRPRKKAADSEDAGADSERSPETPGDDEQVPEPVLSKDEIKAKVASRKTPSKKKTPTAEEKSAAAAAKKAAKANATTKGEKVEVDSKRKKEIELVVPRKSVKSADIREATDEAARKKSGPREKPKDKGDYKIGNLTNFAGKMNRLHANESSKNNDELIQMLTQFFEEKTVFRSDMERSGVAAVVALLRKSANPTVSQTASAVRKHLIKVMVNDVQSEAPASKKTKANGEAEVKPGKKQKTEATAPEQSSSPVEAAVATEDAKEKKETTAESLVEKKKSPSNEDKPEDAVKQSSATPESQHTEPVAEKEPTKVEEKVEEPAKEEPKELAKPEQAAPASPPQKTEPSPTASIARPDPSGDKSRMNCIEMLKKSLASIGDKGAEIAREIEAHVFDRFNESNDEYKECARSIIFGLKKNANVRERLAVGSLTVVELVYTPEQSMKDA